MAEKRKKTKYVIGITLIVILLIDLLPYLWLLISSFRASDDPFTSSVLPSHYTFQNYTNIFQSEDMLRPFFNSLVVAVGATSGSLWIFKVLF